MVLLVRLRGRICAYQGCLWFCYCGVVGRARFSTGYMSFDIHVYLRRLFLLLHTRQTTHFIHCSLLRAKRPMPRSGTNTGRAQLLVWEWQSETYVLKQQGHGYGLNCAAFGATGSVCATGGDDSKVCCVDCGPSDQLFWDNNEIAILYESLQDVCSCCLKNSTNSVLFLKRLFEFVAHNSGRCLIEWRRRRVPAASSAVHLMEKKRDLAKCACEALHDDSSV